MSARGPSIAPRTTLAPSPAATGFASSPESASPGTTVTSIVTSKEWVLPPRPKPGRKPSVDTPVSKRKAQNRAAQRAFRERRATRVQELEQQLLEVEKEKEVKEMGLVNTINRLKFENQMLNKSVEQLRSEFQALRGAVAAGAVAAGTSNSQYAVQQNIVPSSTSASASASASAYKADLNQTAQNLLNFAKSSPAAHGSPSPASSSSVYSVQQISPAPSADSPKQHISHNLSQGQRPNILQRSSVHSHGSQPVPLAATGPAQGDDFDCGVCAKEQCLCEEVGLKEPSISEESFNSFAPMPAVALRGNKSGNSKRKITNQEVDFTAQFAPKKMPDLRRLKKAKTGPVHQHKPKETFNESSPVENCGFCSDDTPCVCREAAKEAARIQALSETQEQEIASEDDRAAADEAGPTPLPPIQARHASFAHAAPLPVMHPGPTFELRDISAFGGPAAGNGAENSENIENAAKPEILDGAETVDGDDKAGCTGNPGTCSQCQTDPMSTLFCSTVASKAAQQGPIAPAGDYFSPRNSISDTRSTLGLDSAKSFTNPSTSASANSPANPSTNPSTPLPSTPGGSANGIFIPCADAYRTLSRHKRFNTIDFSSLVGRLTTRGMQVEVQSVANMIRELDKKVYD